MKIYSQQCLLVNYHCYDDPLENFFNKCLIASILKHKLYGFKNSKYLSQTCEYQSLDSQIELNNLFGALCKLL